MEQETNVLPADFDGVFRFTNFTDTDFTAKWNSIEYTFPSGKTVPLIIPSASAEEVQSIRKKFAKELAIAVFYGTDKFKVLEDAAPAGSGLTPALYTDKDLEPYIQRCLEPLPVSQAKVTVAQKKAVPLRTDDEGNPVTEVLTDSKKSLVGNGSIVG